MDKLIKDFKKKFGIGINGCPMGSCTAEFLLDTAIDLLEKSDLGYEDINNLMGIFRENMYRGLGHFSNGKKAGEKYICLIERYFSSKENKQ